MLSSPTVAAAASPPEPAGDVISMPAAPATLAPPATQLRYSLPWQLRPVTTGNVVRIDSAAAAFNDANGNLDVAVTTVLAASYQLTPDWAPTYVWASSVTTRRARPLDGSSFVNPLVGATHTRSLGSYRLALFGATTIPIGTGSGNARNPGRQDERRVGHGASRGQRDVRGRLHDGDRGCRLRLREPRVHRASRGDRAAVRSRTRTTAQPPPILPDEAAVGLHLGYFIGSHFSLGSDLHYQRWLSHPTTVTR